MGFHTTPNSIVMKIASKIVDERATVVEFYLKAIFSKF